MAFTFLIQHRYIDLTILPLPPNLLLEKSEAGFAKIIFFTMLVI